MLTQEENDLVTQTGAGTPCGRFLRSFWQPAALSQELPSGGPPIPLRLFGEDLVMFRDEQDRIGLLDLHCSHRGTDLSYGRIEDGGLRCVYHGWVYNVDGHCLETPAEPPGSNLHLVVRHPAYLCREAGGVIFAYMGEGEPPLLPNYEALSAAPDHRFAIKHFLECNWLQGLEGSQDATHTRFLHGMLDRPYGVDHQPQEDESDGNGVSYKYSPLGEYAGPERVEENDFSVWVFRHGHGGPEYTFPSLCLTGSPSQGPGNGYMIYWRVPIDDTHHWQFAVTFRREGVMSEGYKQTRGIMTPDYHFIRNQRNRYLQDREEQRTKTFTGIGYDYPPQDSMANETQGAIQDRTRETLGTGDMAIAAWRRMLLRAVRTIEAGGDPPGQIRDPRVNAVDPLFLKRNEPPTEIELDAILEETGGRWVNSHWRTPILV
ncbi:MAG TPA: Rieske 2Fe-2S domain-containing protein [Chloroflexota bacterium]|jgi:phenylpropionate dioxygenase-like ring-hydroxylating dioxygenase large terminal subunit